MDAVIGFFLFGAFGFWIAVALLFFFAVASSADNDESGVLTAVFTIGLVWFVSWAADIPLWSAIKANGWLMNIGVVVAYLLVGFGWSLFKWRRLLSKYDDNNSTKKYRPEFNNKLDDISYWIAFWPTSLTYYVFAEWVIDLLGKIKVLVSKLRFIYDWVEK